MLEIVLFSEASEVLIRPSFSHCIFTLAKVFGSAPEIYITNVMWLQVSQDAGGWKHHRIWSKACSKRRATAVPNSNEFGSAVVRR